MNIPFLKNKLLPLLIIAGLALYQYFSPGSDSGSEQAGLQPNVEESLDQQAGVIEKAYANKRSKVWAEVEGRIARTLPDDNDGHRHQRFILELDSGHTVLVAHNIDLARRVPIDKNDRITLAGRYEWNERGGVIHWTHHDPQNRHDGGWIRFNDKLYK